MCLIDAIDDPRRGRVATALTTKRVHRRQAPEAATARLINTIDRVMDRRGPLSEELSANPLPPAKGRCYTTATPDAG
jgi:hypothetical protein